MKLVVPGTSGLGRVLLAGFAVGTLLMPLLYLPVNYFLLVIPILVICMVLIPAYAKASLYMRLRKFVTRHPVLVVFTGALITRLLVVLVVSLHTKQVSDFAGVYSDSLVSTPVSHTPIWMHYITYPYILHFFVAILGDNHSTLIGGFFNAVVCSASITVTYVLGAAVASRKIGFVAAAVMMLWPSMAVYTAIYAPDHLSVLFTLLSILCFIKVMAIGKSRTKVLYGLACAVALWALGFFKDVTPILVIAFALSLAAHLIKSRQLKDNLIAIYCVLGLCLLAVFSSITHVPVVSAIAGRPVNPSLVSYFVYTGLGGDNFGSWQPKIMDHYIQLIEQKNYNYEAADHTMMHDALGSIKHRLPEIPVTIWNKNRNIQANDDSKLFWVEASADAANSKNLHELLQTIVEPLNDVFFAGVVVLLGAAVWRLWNEREASGLMLLIIICIGYSALLLVIEAQNRYRYLIEPLYSILAAYGFVGIYNARTIRPSEPSD